MKFIFKVKIKKGHTKKQYIDAWKRGSTLIQKSKGAQGTMLYQNMSNPNSLLAVATWKSKKARDAAMKKLHEADQKTREIMTEHQKHGESIIIGNFEEIEKVGKNNNRRAKR